MRFQEGPQCSAHPNSSSWKVEGECRPRALLTDLSESFDCLPLNLVIAKLNAYGFDNKAARFVYDYLTSRKQRTKTSETYSSWQEILSGVPQGSIPQGSIPQGSILGPLLFSIDICD